MQKPRCYPPAPLWGHQAAEFKAIYCSAGYCELSTDLWCSVYCTCLLLTVTRDPRGHKTTLYLPPGGYHAARATLWTHRFYVQVPQTVNIAPKWSHRFYAQVPQTVNIAPKWSQGCPKRIPRGAQEDPKRPQAEPRGPQDDAQRPQSQPHGTPK